MPCEFYPGLSAWVYGWAVATTLAALVLAGWTVRSALRHARLLTDKFLLGQALSSNDAAQRAFAVRAAAGMAPLSDLPRPSPTAPDIPPELADWNSGFTGIALGAPPGTVLPPATHPHPE